MIISQLIDYLIDLKIAMSKKNDNDFNVLKQNLEVLNLSCDRNGNVETIQNKETIEQILCNHDNMEYQAKEEDTNVPEDYYCLDCNKQFELPEPDEDIWRDR